MTKYDISSTKLYSVTSNTKVVVNALEQDLSLIHIFDQFQKPKLQRKAFRVFAREIKPADIVRFPRGYVRQHRDHSDAAQSQQGKDLVLSLIHISAGGF